MIATSTLLGRGNQSTSAWPNTTALLDTSRKGKRNPCWRVIMETSFEKMYSVKEVAALLGWSPDTIRRLIYRGHLRAVMLPRSGRRTRICRHVRIREREIHRFLNSHN